jgi:hypothetical protein
LVRPPKAKKAKVSPQKQFNHTSSGESARESFEVEQVKKNLKAVVCPVAVTSTPPCTTEKQGAASARGEGPKEPTGYNFPASAVSGDISLSEEVARLKAKVAKFRQPAVAKRLNSPGVVEKENVADLLKTPRVVEEEVVAKRPDEAYSGVVESKVAAKRPNAPRVAGSGSGEKSVWRYVCPHCPEPQSYRYLRSLERHVSEVHVGCSVDGYRVVDASTVEPNRRRQLLPRSDESRRWLCTLCGAKVCWKDGLHHHVRKMHKEIHCEFKERSVDRRRCEICSTTFNVLAGKMIHMAEVHAPSAEHESNESVLSENLEAE